MIKLSNVKDFTLTDVYGKKIDDNFKKKRTAHLLATFNTFKPDILITELYHFGRRKFSFELLPLLEMAHKAVKRPIIISSIRDILVESKKERLLATVELIHKYYDMVLVHGDESFIPLSKTFPFADKIAEKIHYSGYVISSTATNVGSKVLAQNQIVVSTGSGGHDFGYSMLMCAIAAKELTELKNFRWHLLVSAQLSVEKYNDLKKYEDANLLIERHRIDVADILQQSKLAIMRGGYNSVMDVYIAKIPAVIIPYSHRGEEEQKLRADTFHKVGRFVSLDYGQMKPESLATSVNTAFHRKENFHNFQLNTAGVRNSISLIKSML
ncbi:MAG: glycosyltransferase [Spirochaetota bacterium]